MASTRMPLGESMLHGTQMDGRSRLDGRDDLPPVKDRCANKVLSKRETVAQHHCSRALEAARIFEG